MAAPKPLSPAAQASVLAIVLLGLLGGCLILAHAGFSTSPPRGGTTTFVPAPQAYLLAGVLFCMSVIGLAALLRNRQVSGGVTALAVVLYAFAAAWLTQALAPS